MNEGSILIIDDQFEELNMIISFLVEAFPNYQLLNAPNGKVGWQMIKEHKPQLVLTDWEMPELNGIQLTQLIKSVDQLKEIPVILMTGSMTSSHDLKTALETGTIDYIRKPIDFIELKARMQSALRMFKAQQEIERQHQVIQDMLKADKERLSLEIDTKARKLSTNTLLTAEKNELLAKVNKELIEIAPLLTDHPSKQRVIQSLIKELKSQNRLDSSWDDFKLHFEEVHPRFFQELKAQSDQLTAQDLKISAYLKLGLGNNEIASLLNITTASVRKSTYRLKKKLELDEETSIRDFINGLG